LAKEAATYWTTLKKVAAYGNKVEAPSEQTLSRISASEWNKIAADFHSEEVLLTAKMTSAEL